METEILKTKAEFFTVLNSELRRDIIAYISDLLRYATPDNPKTVNIVLENFYAETIEMPSPVVLALYKSGNSFIAVLNIENWEMQAEEMSTLDLIDIFQGLL